MVKYKETAHDSDKDVTSELEDVHNGCDIDTLDALINLRFEHVLLSAAIKA